MPKTSAVLRLIAIPTDLFGGIWSLVIPNEVPEWSGRGERQRWLRREGSGEKVGRGTSQFLDVK